MTRPGLRAGAFAVLFSGGVLVLAAWAADTRHLLPLSLAVLASVWGCAPIIAVLLGSRNRRTPRAPDPGDERASVTTIVKVGDEPIEIARSTVALARRAGATIVVTTRDDLDELDTHDDRVHRGAGIGDAISSAAAVATSDAVLIVSARAVPDLLECERVAAQLDDSTGWVTGATRPFNHDRYAPGHQEQVAAALRSHCSTELVVWEPDATLVRRELLVDHPLGDAPSWGAWLRRRAADGVAGTRTDATLSLRAAPVAAREYWPDADARQRANAVDLSLAAGTGSTAARCAALLLLARELYAYPLLLWLGAAMTFDPTGLGISAWLLALLLVLAPLSRWWGLRTALGVDLHPRTDLMAALYRLPGSIGALPAAVTRRLRSRRRPVGSRPLVWAAIVLTFALGWVLVGRSLTDGGSSPPRFAAALCLVGLGLLWTFAIRAIVERSWQRASYRVRLSLECQVDGVSATVVDGSPGGLGVRLDGAGPNWSTGDEVTVSIQLDDGSTVEAAAVVATRRRHHQGHLVGLELRPSGSGAAAWAAQLLRAATSPAPLQRPGRPARSAMAVAADRLVVGLSVGVSLVVAAALVLVLLGIRPYVIRSGSMVPTYGVGDVVLVEQVPASQLRPGDVASLSHYEEFGEGLTHRIVEVTPDDGVLVFETRGDANGTSETWAARPDQPVGRVIASVPHIGSPTTMARTSEVPLAILVLVVAVIAAAVLFGRRRGEPDAAPADESELETVSEERPAPT